MSVPRIVSAEEWLAERKELLAAEEQAAEMLTRVRARRHALPAVLVDEEYLFDGPDGRVSLLDMFQGRLQLIIQHFMFDPAWDEGCPVCSYQADNVGDLAHLHARNTTFAAVSRAPIDKIEAFRCRMGWKFPWYSSLRSDFNYDFHVTHDEDVAPIEWNFRTKQELIDIGQAWAARPGEQGGVSVFYRDGDRVLHTYTGFRVADLLSATDQYLDLTPLGRQDETVELMHHDRYAAS
jgi:predicted dithiol-disulfide oxidoreductase (DUF899 family)